MKLSPAASEIYEYLSQAATKLVMHSPTGRIRTVVLNHRGGEIFCLAPGEMATVHTPGGSVEIQCEPTNIFQLTKRLDTVRSECGDTLRDVTVDACRHGYTWQCPKAASEIDDHAALTAYLLSAVRRKDWHAVSDAANDLRVLEASRR